jgi:hypothetical protein
MLEWLHGSLALSNTVKLVCSSGLCPVGRSDAVPVRPARLPPRIHDPGRLLQRHAQDLPRPEDAHHWPGRRSLARRPIRNNASYGPSPLKIMRRVDDMFDSNCRHQNSCNVNYLSSWLVPHYCGPSVFRPHLGEPGQPQYTHVRFSESLLSDSSHL